MQICIDEASLAKRSNQVKKILSSINNKIAGYKIMKDHYTVLLIWKENSTIPNEEAFFKTGNNKVKASYKELWKKFPDNKDWYLWKANLKLVNMVDHSSYPEILSFHNDLEKSELKYKNIPHMHIKHPKNECITNGHIALNLSDHDKINTIEAFDANLTRIFEMINCEFILKYN